MAIKREKEEPKKSVALKEEPASQQSTPNITVNNDGLISSINKLIETISKKELSVQVNVPEQIVQDNSSELLVLKEKINILENTPKKNMSLKIQVIRNYNGDADFYLVKPYVEESTSVKFGE